MDQPIRITAATAALLFCLSSAYAGKGPVGWQTYRQLDRLPEMTTGVQTRQFSSYDRSGGNNDGFEGTYSCLRTTRLGCVIAEASGAGEVQSIWFTRDGGDVTRTGDIIIQLDGRTVVKTSLQRLVDGGLGAPFVYPLVANADQSSGGVYIKVPMPYRTSMRITVQNNPYFYHVSYRTFSDAVGVTTFDITDKAQDVIDKWRAAGTADPKPSQPGALTRSGSFTLAPGATKILTDLQGPGLISALRLRIPQLQGPTPGAEVTDDGRAFGSGGYSQFTVAVSSSNGGVRLTRRLDAGIANQRARVVVNGVTAGEWQPLAATSGNQWVDQFVDLPSTITSGKSSLTIRNEFISSSVDFNEFTYWVDSRVNGVLTRTDSVNVGAQSLASESAHAYKIVGQTWEGVRTFRYPPSGDAAVIAASDAVLSGARLRVTFDGARTVDAPLGEFFGSGLGEYAVRSLFFGIDTSSTGWYSSWWPMPYHQTARVEIFNGSAESITTADWEIVSSQSTRWSTAPYFRTSSHRDPTRPSRDWNFLDTRGQAKVVGVTHTMEGRADRLYLEGDERAYVDGSATAQFHGTGTEDFYEGGWYFNRGTFNAPTNGNPAHEVNGFGCAADCTGAYRLLIGDAIPFETSIRFGIEHGPVNDIPATYSSTTYWYSASPSSYCTPQGAILEKYNQLGGAGGVLGPCASSELATPDGVGRYNDFEAGGGGGSIYWTQATGAHEVHHAIRAKWAALGWEKSAIGYPVTDQTRTPDGIGRFNHFQFGSIYWSPATGANEVRGAIRDKWASMGWERGFLGYPLTDETATPDGRGRFNHFQGGSIYWTPTTTAHEVHGAIRDKWASMGWEMSCLGYPTSDEYDWNGGKRSDFERGYIHWTPAAGASATCQ